MDVRVISQLIEDLALFLQPVRGNWSVTVPSLVDSTPSVDESVTICSGVENEVSNLAETMAKDMITRSEVHSMMSTCEIHRRSGCPGEGVSKAQGIPHPGYCDVCEMGNRKKAAKTKGVVPRGSSFGQCIHVDFKISSVPDTDNVTVLCGGVDDATNYE